jgi:DNA repair exonuclease SbcCD ATPase subunit
VALLRGKKNEYVLIPEGEPEQQKSFTKLAGGVPEEVSEFIGIPAKDPLNYSNQFDMPYLLTSSAADVARTLGELTNVSVIFEASREANKRRLSASSVLKTRAGDFADLTQNLDKFRSLKDDLAAQEQAEQVLARAQTIQTRIVKLEAVLKGITAIPEVPAPKQYPDLTAVETLQQRVTRLHKILHALTTYTEAEESYTRAADTAHQAAVQAQDTYTQALQDMGTCPTCGQDTQHLHE